MKYSIPMVIQEMWVPEIFIILFLALPLLRPFIKKLWPIEGLAWLPLISLGITLGIFPAYGFRFECIPMFIFVLIFNIVNLPILIASIASRHNDSFRDRGPLLIVLALALLGVVAVPMFAFSPIVRDGPAIELEPVRTVRMNSIEGPARVFGREYFLRIYGKVQPNRPLIFLVPPEIGSAASVDLVCTELQGKGYTVVSYSRKGYDAILIDENGRKRLSSPVKLLTYWRVLTRAANFSSANERGKALEAERRLDIIFLLSRLPSLLDDAKNDNVPPLLLVGYGAGGSALAYLVGESNFTSRYNNILGVVAIESRLWPSYLPDPRSVPEIPDDTGIARRYLAHVVNFVNDLRPLQVSRTGPLPNTDFPLLYVVSGIAMDPHKEQKSYQAIFDHIRSVPGPVALAAIEGAGLLDYQDFPLLHPISSFLLPGLEGAQKSENPIGDTASIIGNFGSFLIERAGQEGKTSVTIPPHQDINGSLYVESKGMPGFRL
jgi:hypothetical protein